MAEGRGALSCPAFSEHLGLCGLLYIRWLSLASQALREAQLEVKTEPGPPSLDVCPLPPHLLSLAIQSPHHAPSAIFSPIIPPIPLGSTRRPPGRMTPSASVFDPLSRYLLPSKQSQPAPADRRLTPWLWAGA